jgi:glycosyltransferase involved in cell wall biosynthesis
MDRSLARAEVVVSTLATRDDLVRNHRLAPSRATVVPLGVDLDRFRPAADGRADPPYFFTLSSADDRDRTDLVLQAFARYRSAPGGRGRLVIGGSLGDRVEGLQRMAAQLGIAGEVELPGRLTDDELAGCNARAVATVHASSDEGFGLQPLEAMAGGSLLIATRTPSLEEVAAGAVVLWVDPTADAMAEAMARAGDDPGLAVRAGTENRRVAEGYSWDRSAGRLHELMVGLADR